MNKKSILSVLTLALFSASSFLYSNVYAYGYGGYGVPAVIRSNTSVISPAPAVIHSSTFVTYNPPPVIHTPTPTISGPPPVIHTPTPTTSGPPPVIHTPTPTISGPPPVIHNPPSTIIAPHDPRHPHYQIYHATGLCHGPNRAYHHSYCLEN